jgi:hypothetical protein
MPNPHKKPEPPTPVTPVDPPEPVPGDPPPRHEPGPDQQIQERQRRKVQKQLDEALEDSFPASDPVSIVTSQAEEDWGEGETAPSPAPPSRKED